MPQSDLYEICHAWLVTMSAHWDYFFGRITCLKPSLVTSHANIPEWADRMQNVTNPQNAWLVTMAALWDVFFGRITCRKPPLVTSHGKPSIGMGMPKCCKCRYCVTCDFASHRCGWLHSISRLFRNISHTDFQVLETYNHFVHHWLLYGFSR
jgi:hypothetical protein